ncbi:Dihydroxy-acid dehydratase OS=Streptomyces fumanus OX=67302 GN=ilvD PE=3 SV=1 [Streptomyces fumanus]
MAELLVRIPDAKVALSTASVYPESTATASRSPGGSPSPEAVELWHAAPGCVRSAEAFSQSERWDTLDEDAEGGCIRSAEHAYSKDGGLAVLRGNLAVDGCVVDDGRCRRVDLDLRGPRGGLRVAGAGRGEDPHPAGQGGRRGRHPLRGPQGRPRHAGDALPDLVPQGPRAGQGVRAGHRRPLLRRHLRPVHRPRQPRGGLRRHLALVQDGDRIRIDIPARTGTPRRRRRTRPPRAGPERRLRPREPRPQVSAALRAYAAMATSADKGAVRDVSKLG